MESTTPSEDKLLQVLGEKVEGSVRVEFAKVPYCVVNLYNIADLSAKSFTAEVE